MSDSLGFVLAIIFAEVVPAAIYLYAAYWAFAIRRALVGRIYRNHAFWLGAVGVLVAFTGFLTYSDNLAVNGALSVFYAVLFVVVFGFIDASVRVARRSDPLLRSILRWEKVRLVLWGDVAALTIVNVLPIVSPSFMGSPAGEFVGNIGWTALASIMTLVSGAALVIGARRSGDRILRGSLKWLGVLLFSVVIMSIVQAIQTTVLGTGPFDLYYSYAALPGAAFDILGGYALYRSARSIAPINRLRLDDAEVELVAGGP